MRKYVSVGLLVLRASLYKLAALLLASGAVQALLVFLTLRRSTARGAVLSIERLVEKSGIVWVFAACFVLTLVLLCRMGCAYGAKTGYTLKRLSVSEKAVFFCQSISNSLCLIVLWLMQAAFTYFLLSAASAGIEGAGVQGVMLAFYRSKFLHSLFPLASASLWIRNVVFALSIGISAAAFAWHQRRGKPGIGVGVLALIAFVFFCQDVGSVYTDCTLIFFVLTSVAAVLLNVLGKESGDEDTQG